MNICYEVICTKRYVEDHGLCSVFGLKASGGEGQPSEVLCCIEDISPNRQFVETLCDLLLHHSVHPLHIKDIIIDAIS